MKLSKNFNLYEFTKTSKPFLNNPSSLEIDNIKELVINVIQPARDTLNSAITITSGYRSEKVNKAVGGEIYSQHLTGHAADIICSDKRKLFEIIREQNNFDQLIWEFGNDFEPSWIHVSYNKNNNRKNVLRSIKKNGKTEYIYI
jgi:zinc D-Ala-D-Ala carboxypeptidase